MGLDSRAGRKSPITLWLTLSLGTHIALVVLLWATQSWLSQKATPPQHVLATRLVRLGPRREETLLPRLDASRAPKAVPQPQPNKPVPKQAKAPVASSSQPSAQTHSALSRLRQQLAGQADGVEEGDTDEAQQGEVYLAQIKKCLTDHYVIEGSSRSQVVGRVVVVVLKIQADGRIISHHIEKSSGIPAFDQAVQSAIVGCGRVAAPPATWQRSLRQEGIQIDFEI